MVRPITEAEDALTQSSTFVNQLEKELHQTRVYIMRKRMQYNGMPAPTVSELEVAFEKNRDSLKDAIKAIKADRSNHAKSNSFFRKFLRKIGLGD